MYRVSKNYDLNVPFGKLIEYNKTCKIDLNSKHHFETYEGDYGCQDNFKEIPIEKGLNILSRYREFINAKLDLEYKLLKNKLDKNGTRIELK